MLLKDLKVEQVYMKEEMDYQLTQEILPKLNSNGNKLKRKESKNRRRKQNKLKEFKNKRELNRLKRFD